MGEMASPWCGSTVVELQSASPFGVLGDPDTEPCGLLRFVPAPAPSDDEVVPVIPVDGHLVHDQPSNRFLAVSLRSVASLADLAGITPDFLVLEPDAVDLRAGDHVMGEVAAVAAYGEARSIELVAVGIADQLQYDQLRHLGVRYGAGPHIDRRLAQGERLTPAHAPQERSGWIRTLLASLETVQDVTDAVCEHVGALGLLPSVYIERNGLLRCVSQRGYWQVMDGIPVDMGVLGRTFCSGAPHHIDASADAEFIAAVPGIVAEITIPIAVDGRTRGVFSVESTRPFRPAEVHEMERIGRALGRAIDRIGLEDHVSAMRWLVRANAELSGATDEAAVAHAAVRLACSIAATSSAMIAFAGPDQGEEIAVRAVAGPLAPALRRLDPGKMRALAAELGGISSSISGGDEGGRVHPVFADIRGSGGTSLGVFPVRCSDGEPGLLFAADQSPGGLDGEQCEAMELLAAAVARSLDHVWLLQALRFRAERDPLTMVGNRGAFDEALVILDGADDAGQPVAVLLADIDWFKQVNDRFGHVTGDQVLVETAQAMLDCLRQGDRLFRIGGDEFAIVVPGMDHASAVDLAARLVDRARPQLERFGAGLSVGAAVREPGETMEECMIRADRCLYEAKAARTASRP